MANHGAALPEALSDFTTEAFTHAGVERTVYRLGEGPAVIITAEMPGITPAVAHFARRVAARDLSVWMPQLFGTPGRPPSTGAYLRALPPACVARDFAAFATNATAPVVDWLRALAAHAHEQCGGPGVGAVGMCFTGGFALGMMVDDRMLAPVLSQPSLPLRVPWRRGNAASVHLAPADAERVRQRAAGGACALGLRFTNDPLVPPQRFASLADLLGDGFTAVEIDSSPGNPEGIGPRAHSVLTEELVDRPGHPTYDALEQVLAFCEERLLGRT